MPTSLTINFNSILQNLDEAQVRFVVIGGVALSLHGASNVTIDIDISFARDKANTDALASMLVAQNARMRDFPPDLPFVLDGQMLRNSTNLTLQTQLGPFDLLAEPEGVDNFDGLWERSVVMTVQGRAVRVASIPDLIAMKQAANQPTQGSRAYRSSTGSTRSPRQADFVVIQRYI